MLNGNYKLVTSFNIVKIQYANGSANGVTIASVLNDDEGNRIIGAIREQILKDGGTLFNADTQQYIVGSVAQLDGY